MAAILKSAQKGGGGPTYMAYISIIDQWLGGGVHGDPSGPMDYRVLIIFLSPHWRNYHNSPTIYIASPARLFSFGISEISQNDCHNYVIGVYRIFVEILAEVVRISGQNEN